MTNLASFNKALYTFNVSITIRIEARTKFINLPANKQAWILEDWNEWNELDLLHEVLYKNWYKHLYKDGKSDDLLQELTEEVSELKCYQGIVNNVNKITTLAKKIEQIKASKQNTLQMENIRGTKFWRRAKFLSNN